jgi:superoxide reductase
MAAKLEIYKCDVCGNIVEVVHGGKGQLVCCGEPMTLLKENTTDAATEKHVPVIEKVDGGYKVKVGSVAHPMEEKHYIEWIELLAGDEAIFHVEAKDVSAREYCNIHGLWKGE